MEQMIVARADTEMKMSENNTKKRRFKVKVEGQDYIVEVEELPAEDVCDNENAPNAAFADLPRTADKPSVTDAGLKR